MEKNPYQKFKKEELILRDLLAADRTILANERTYLAYIRTALTLFVSGATFIRFFDSVILEVLGWAFVPAAIIVFLVGTKRFREMRQSLRPIKE
ncbi:MAG: DUF202 domain-containing protein [Calditrichaeota bacterium]|nr:DUF202 domain-containing protein [Calditrichota bacterium]